MQQSTTQPKPPSPNDMVLMLFSKFILKLFGVINANSKDIQAADVEEKFTHLKKMLDKNIITEEQYSTAIEKLLTEYIKCPSRKNEKNTLSEYEKYIL